MKTPHREAASTDAKPAPRKRVSRHRDDPLNRDTPTWYDEAKLGIFIHWSPAAIPAYAPLAYIDDLNHLGNDYGAYQPPDRDGIDKAWRRLPYAIIYENALLIPHSPTARYHQEKYGDLTYEVFGQHFREQSIPACNPETWADLCARSGARYAVLTTKHQDGFVMWPTKHRNPHRENWQVDDRDVIGEFASALRGRGLRFGAYYCAGVDNTFGKVPIMDTVTFLGHSDTFPDSYLDYATAHWYELIDRYEPSVLWNDYSFPGSRANLRQLLRSYVQRVPDGVINNRFQAKPGTHLQPCPVYSDFTTPEYSTEGSPTTKWEACRSIGLSWGYNALESEKTYLSVESLIRMFVDIVSRGGNLLININPTATGEIPWGEAQRLLALGWWLRDNGEAIYGTRPWQIHAGLTLDAQQVRYTQSRDAVYAIVLDTPPRPVVDLDVVLGDGAHVSMLGHSASLPWRNTPVGVRIDLPEQPPERPALSLRLFPASEVRSTP